MEKAQETLAESEEQLADAQEELAEKEALLAEEKKVLENALFTAEGTDKENALYWWIIAWQTADEAQEMADTLEDEINQLHIYNCAFAHFSPQPFITHDSMPLPELAVMP